MVGTPSPIDTITDSQIRMKTLLSPLRWRAVNMRQWKIHWVKKSTMRDKDMTLVTLKNFSCSCGLFPVSLSS